MPVAAVGFRGDGDDARRRRGLEAVEQQIGQQKRREVIDRKGQLEPVRRKPVLRRKQAGIVDEHVEPVVRRTESRPPAGGPPRAAKNRRAPYRPGPSPSARRPTGAPARSAHGRGRSSRPASRRARAQRGVKPDPGTRPRHDRDPLRPVFSRGNHARGSNRRLLTFGIHPPHRHARESGIRACPWLEQGAAGPAPVALGPRFRGGDEQLRQWNRGVGACRSRVAF